MNQNVREIGSEDEKVWWKEKGCQKRRYLQVMFSFLQRLVRKPSTVAAPSATPTRIYDAEFIHRWEGLRLKAYQDIAGIWTIGYGTTKNVKPGMVITKEQAEQFFRKDIKWVENAINTQVKVRLNQNQFDALASLIYNIGAGAFGRSTLLKRLNAGLYQEAADQFLVWNKARNPRTGQLEFSRGLMNRREDERKKFLS